ncbi:MAG: RNA pseudouridine synthase [Spirochaetes bacterium]|nr:RNA pseudouridine synthase [Spirochaetota bacterium]
MYEQKGAQDSLLGQLQRWLITQKGKEKESKEKGEKGDILQGARAGVLEANYNQSSPNLPYLGLVHRIDQPVTGVVLFARDPATLELLNRQFRDRQVFKLYWAVTESRPPKDTGTLEHSITFDPKKNKSRIFTPSDPGDIRIPGRQPRAKKALLHYRVVGNSERYFFLEIELITGRPHQIRAQLAAIGCPIKGDLKYGARRSNPGGGILLHARSIRFTHPKTGLPLTLTAEPPPSILWELFPRSSRS